MSFSIKTRNILLYGSLIIIAIGGFCFRIYKYPVIPPGLNQDEASAAYDAYSIAKYGIDRNGDRFPVHFVGWGNGQSALYHYLVMPFIKVFGLSPATSRIGNLLAGMASIIVFFFLGKALGNPLLGIIGAFLIAFAPWSIMASRWGPEASILPPVLLIAVFLYVKAFADWRYLVPSFIVLALSFYAYSPAYFFTPLFLLYLIWHIRHYFAGIGAYVKKTGISLAAFVAISVPIGLFILINIVIKSAHAFSVLGITIPKMVQTGCRYEKFVFLDSGARGMGRFLQVLQQNFEYFYNTVFRQEGASWCVLQPFGYYYEFSNIFLIIGLLTAAIQWIRAIAKRKPYAESVFLVWFALASLLGIFLETNPFRVNAIFFALFFFVAKGIYETGVALAATVSYFFKNRLAGIIVQANFLVVLAAVYLGNTFIFFPHYLTTASSYLGSFFRESFDEAIAYADSIRAPGQNLYVSDEDPSTSYVYVLYYRKIDPRLFSRQVVYQDPASEWRPVSGFGPYKFTGDRSLFSNPVPNAVYLVQNSDAGLFPERPGMVRREFKLFTVLKY
jgi:hypothetical protein